MPIETEADRKFRETQVQTMTVTTATAEEPLVVVPTFRIAPVIVIPDDEPC